MSKQPTMQERIAILKEAIFEFKEVQEYYDKQRYSWPKLVRISVSKGAWDQEVLETLAQNCGWSVDGEGKVGPMEDGKNLCAEAYLYFLTQEDGKMELVGAECEGFGKIGRTK